MRMTTEQIVDTLAEHGRWHTFDIRSRPPDQSQSVTEILDEYVTSLLTFQQEKHFRPLGENWIEISNADARHILDRILAFDLAYDSPDIDKPLANAIGDSFLDAFKENARYFTNGTFSSTGLSSWNRLTEATLDSGVVAMDSVAIGLLWVEDED